MNTKKYTFLFIKKYKLSKIFLHHFNLFTTFLNNIFLKLFLLITIAFIFILFFLVLIPNYTKGFNFLKNQFKILLENKIKYTNRNWCYILETVSLNFL